MRSNSSVLHKSYCHARQQKSGGLSPIQDPEDCKPFAREGLNKSLSIRHGTPDHDLIDLFRPSLGNPR